MKKLYIGNLSYKTSEDALREAFAKYASVTSVKVVTDKFSGESRGFGFIELSDAAEASSAISEMDGFSLGGKNLRVNEARPQTQGSGGGAARFR
jgi:cold-inducible RNA-binding protein